MFKILIKLELERQIQPNQFFSNIISAVVRQTLDLVRGMGQIRDPRGGFKNKGMTKEIT